MSDMRINHQPHISSYDQTERSSESNATITEYSKSYNKTDVVG